VLGASGWRLAGIDPVGSAEKVVREPISRLYRWFVPLVVAYFLEGVGYIIAGTFLVATVATSAPGELGKTTWIMVGLAAIPSCVLWVQLNARLSHPTLLTAALGLQAAGIMLAGLDVGLVGAVVAAVLFGGTFMGVTTIALDAGNHLQVPAAVAILSAVYAVGQAAGPVAVAPLLSGGFRSALFLAAGVVALAALAAVMLRVRFPDARPVPDPTVAMPPLVSAALDRWKEHL